MKYKIKINGQIIQIFETLDLANIAAEKIVNEAMDAGEQICPVIEPVYKYENLD